MKDYKQLAEEYIKKEELDGTLSVIQTMSAHAVRHFAQYLNELDEPTTKPECEHDYCLRHDLAYCKYDPRSLPKPLDSVQKPCEIDGLDFCSHRYPLTPKYSPQKPPKIEKLVNIKFISNNGMSPHLSEDSCKDLIRVLNQLVDDANRRNGHE